MRNYEVIVVYDPALSEEAVEGEIERVKGLIAKEGGQVQDLQKWGKKRLAYEVKKKREAVYVLCRFAAPPGALKELDEVAYVRFASVYRQFQDVSQFSETVNQLKGLLKDDKAKPAVTPKPRILAKSTK